MLRGMFLYLSSAGWARTFTTNFPLAQRATRRFVAGETVEAAIEATRRLNAKGLLASLDILGENTHSEADALRSTEAYLYLIDAIRAAQVQTSCSLKLTQLGLDLGEEIAVKNLRRILEKAHDVGLDITIDMESSEYTERTLRIYRMVRDEYGFKNVSTVIQAYLFRSADDMRALAQEGAHIRLCKGAYQEPPEVAFPEKVDVDANTVRIMKDFMRAENRARGAYLMIATHDPNIIREAEEYIQANNIPSSEFEFQMLYGIRSTTQEQLAARGYQMRVYVPFGMEWYPYFMRRLAERPANVWFILKNLVRG
ncbi:MAG: proline dehydrogenase family protein [Burkholderiales bacterium]|nr:proline dehydrogenase family protein [Anaerolineae bacterium]